MLISSENFKLAWERVRYFDRSDSRDWIGLKVFAANRDHNLEMLCKSLIARTFQPSYPEIKYLPKPSQTLRPMAVLAISDRVIFQAMANVVAEKGRSTLSMVANRQSFANALSAPGQKQMFLGWKSQYRLFQRRFCTLVEEEDNYWVAETDIAAFYETIDHSILFDRLLKGKFLDDRVIEYLKAYLPVWTSIKSGSGASKGIPQGCLASDLLANVFLCELDEDLAVQEFHYLRYVDDIRLLARTREAAQCGLIRIDRTLKSMGLVLQTQKTTVHQITDITEEVDRMAAQLSEIDRRFNEPIDLSKQTLIDLLSEPQLHDVALKGEECDTEANHMHTTPLVQDELLALFRQSKDFIDSNNGSDPFAERHLRFCLYRLAPNPTVVNSVLLYLIERPWLSEIIYLYLQRCKLTQNAVEHLFNIIETHNVYDSVVALAIETLVKQPVSLRSKHSLFRQWLTDSKRDWLLLCTATIALGENSDNLTVLLKAARSSASPSVRRMSFIQALRLAKDNHEAVYILKFGIRDSASAVTDAMLYLLYNEWTLTLEKLGLDEEEQPTEYCINCARGYDSRLPEIQPCYLRHIFTSFYEVKFSTLVDFHTLLGSEYSRAGDFLLQAQLSYLSNPSRYVSQLNLFHEELLFPILVDRLNWKSSRGEVVKVALPDRMKYLQKNRNQLSTFANELLACHDLRSSSTEAHTRLHQVLETTSPISWRQRDGIKRKLCGAYQDFADWLSTERKSQTHLDEDAWS